jgi:toxin ParE1/3/4
MLVRPEAEQDLTAARDWYDQKRVGLGDEFLDTVAGAMRERDRDSELPRVYFRNFRHVLLRRFPYKIFFR